MKKQSKNINDLRNSKVQLIQKLDLKNLKGGLGDPPPFGRNRGAGDPPPFGRD